MKYPLLPLRKNKSVKCCIKWLKLIWKENKMNEFSADIMISIDVYKTML